MLACVSEHRRLRHPVFSGIVAAIAALEAIGEIVVALGDRDLFAASVWFIIAASMFVLVALIERIKAIRGDV